MSNFGRILHFTYDTGHTYAGRVFPAIVTREYEDESGDYVDLCVFSATPDVQHDVPLVEEPERGCAHPAQLAGGNWSTVRYIDEDGNAHDEVPQPEDYEEFDEDAAGGDAEGSEEGLQTAGEQPVEFAPELPGAGTPLVDASGMDTDVVVNELPPADRDPISATRDEPPPALEDISAGRPGSGSDEGGPI